MLAGKDVDAMIGDWTAVGAMGNAAEHEAVEDAAVEETVQTGKWPCTWLLYDKERDVLLRERESSHPIEFYIIW